jgi:hypothetical protein
MMITIPPHVACAGLLSEAMEKVFVTVFMGAALGQERSLTESGHRSASDPQESLDFTKCLPVSCHS